ncbi:MAG: alpha/beta hydrolase [Chloroflexota bacterium]
MPTYPYAALQPKKIDALGIETSYYEAGVFPEAAQNGRFTLLLHGMSTSADSYRETFHELSDSFAFIAPDLPGFGYSAQTMPYTIPHLVEWLAAFCDAKGLQQVDIVGHSFGGLLAASFALAYPEWCRRLLLVAPALLDLDYPDFLLKAGISLGLVDLGTAVTQSPLWINRQIRIPFYEPDKQDGSVWERRLHDYENARATADVVKTVTTNRIWQKIEGLRAETAVVWGENDTVLPISNLDTLQAKLPQAQVYRLTDCGHAPMLEQQAAFQTIMRDFF